MAVSYTWSVLQMSAYPEYQGETDVVFIVNWGLTGADGDYTGYVYGSTGVELDPESPFTPYDQLTQDQVIGWVQSALGEEQVASYEANVANQIENKKNPPVVTPPLPWAPIPTPEPVTVIEEPEA